MAMMMLDLGTTLAIWALALATIPLPDVFIGWFCMIVPSMRSPATRMGELDDSLRSTTQLLELSLPDWPGVAPEGVSIKTSQDWEAHWDIIQKEAKSLRVLVKRGGWGRYSVAHLMLCTRQVKRLNDKFTLVTDKLVSFNKKVFTHMDGVLDPPQKQKRGAASVQRGLRPPFRGRKGAKNEVEDGELKTTASSAPRAHLHLPSRSSSQYPILMHPDGDGGRRFEEDDVDQAAGNSDVEERNSFYYQSSTRDVEMNE